MYEGALQDTILMASNSVLYKKLAMALASNTLADDAR
jgi:hypothetical protein